MLTRSNFSLRLLLYNVLEFQNNVKSFSKDLLLMRCKWSYTIKALTVIGTNSNYLIKCQLMASGCQHWRYSLGGATTNITLQYGSLYWSLTGPLLSASTSHGTFEIFLNNPTDVCPYCFREIPLVLMIFSRISTLHPPQCRGHF